MPLHGGMLRKLLQCVDTMSLPTAFQEVEVHKQEQVDDFWQKEETGYDLSEGADNLPLCEDLNPGQVGNGDSCWSTCHGQCPNDVLQPGLAFDFDEIRPGHPGCTSHFECVGNIDRILCHAVRALDAHMPSVLAVAAPELKVNFRPRSQQRKLCAEFL
eukprot:TRINITY_DN67410_c0_g1_i1.p1 TRINITY_DN67410_c0_g1~~TRINITY_DN67410_c0_g1_i1.p1  ORF type:complete len:170 (+),score=28.10 TRINITY_DN67410_c0_g1_i1:38-511(+)